MIIGSIAKIAVSAAVGGYIGIKTSDALDKAINKIEKHVRVKKAKKMNEEAERTYYLNKNYKIESLV